jgi:2-polyprenyl-6-hydroxyphenyl methylase/3-demethylubiquinone-9 3-methyltransferase
VVSVPVDNSIYDGDGDIWWDESSPLNSLRTAVNPGRVGYLKTVVERAGLRSGSKALDVGCGGGLMAEEVAELGFVVVGVDPSAPSIATARTHAEASGLRIEYRQASGEALPFADGAFDLVYCCDVIEHVANPDLLIAESARVLRPGGVYVFDTINRTIPSQVVMIKLFQDWRPTRFMPRNLHDWRKFIKPSELLPLLERHGLRNKEIVGLSPSAAPPKLIGLLRAIHRGDITPGEMGRRSPFRVTQNRSILYAGYAVKEATAPH